MHGFLFPPSYITHLKVFCCGFQHSFSNRLKQRSLECVCPVFVHAPHLARAKISDGHDSRSMLCVWGRRAWSAHPINAQLSFCGIPVVKNILSFSFSSLSFLCICFPSFQSRIRLHSFMFMFSLFSNFRLYFYILSVARFLKLQ